MKKGGFVRVVDGSYSMLSDNGNPANSSNGLILGGEGIWKILQIGKFPKYTCNDTHNLLKICAEKESFGGKTVPYTGKKEINNVKLQSVKSPSRIAWTQLRFCYSVEGK